MGLTDAGKTSMNEYNYDDALRGRFQPIDEIGTSQNDYAAEANQRRVAMKQQRDSEALANSTKVQAIDPKSFGHTGTSGTSGSAPTSSNAKGNNFESFVGAISSQESGNYSARNGSSGAMGKYQVMPSNLGGAKNGWDYEALGYDINPSQFMANPQLQEKIARHKLQEYYNKYGPAGAAIAWYAGPGMVGRNLNGRAGSGGQGAYPSINNYRDSILRKMGL